MKVCPKLLYLPNESAQVSQEGPRRFFEAMAAERQLADYQAYSFLCEADTLGSDRAALDRLHGIANEFQPDIILWQHISRFGATREDFIRLKIIESHPTLVYHEADMYGGLIKPPSREMLALARESDLVFIAGLGIWAQWLRARGVHNLRYIPKFVHHALFDTPWEPPLDRDFDIVMIANMVDSRLPIPGRRMPGAAERAKLARTLRRIHGDRFALFGRNWERYGLSATSIPSIEQTNVMRRSWMSVIWDHYPDVPYYFSDRLPISLFSGVLHVTNYHPGYEVLFRNGHDLIYCKTVDDMIDAIDCCLGRPKKDLIEIGCNGRDYARKHLTLDHGLRDLIRQVVEFRWPGQDGNDRTSDV